MTRTAQRRAQAAKAQRNEAIADALTKAGWLAIAALPFAFFIAAGALGWPL